MPTERTALLVADDLTVSDHYHSDSDNVTKEPIL